MVVSLSIQYFLEFTVIPCLYARQDGRQYHDTFTMGEPNNGNLVSLVDNYYVVLCCPRWGLHMVSHVAPWGLLR